MIYSRIINGIPSSTYTDDFISENKNNFIDGVLVSQWVLAPEYKGNFVSPKWNGEEYYESATPEEIEEYNRKDIPKVVSQRQLRTQLIIQGISVAEIETVINSLPTQDRLIAQVAWDYAVTFERESPLLIGIASALGFSASDVDNIFINASLL